MDEELKQRIDAFLNTPEQRAKTRAFNRNVKKVQKEMERLKRKGYKVDGLKWGFMGNQFAREESEMVFTISKTITYQ